MKCRAGDILIWKAAPDSGLWRVEAMDGEMVTEIRDIRFRPGAFPWGEHLRNNIIPQEMDRYWEKDVFLSEVSHAKHV